jgi:hypothetical protein
VGVLLGPVYLDGFEVSARIRFGGSQKLTVHKLAGGARVIDAMGRDDDVIRWQGILSGNDATDRARALDRLRIAGQALPLSWDVYSATVIVSTLRMEFHNSWWIPYQIGCTVLTNGQPADQDVSGSDVLAGILADLGTALSIPGADLALAAVRAAGQAGAGSQPYATASTALLAAGASLTASITNTEAGMASTNIADLVSAAGSLATYTAASGFLGRATLNFNQQGL